MREWRGRVDQRGEKGLELGVVWAWRVSGQRRCNGCVKDGGRVVTPPRTHQIRARKSRAPRGRALSDLACLPPRVRRTRSAGGVSVTDPP